MRIYLVKVLARAKATERRLIETMRDLQMTGTNGQSVPLAAVATLRYEIEDPTIWPRSRLPTIALKAGIIEPVQPATIADQLKPKLAEFSAKLPPGYSVATGGSVEESTKSQAPILAVIPLMLFIMATLLMLQLQSFHQLFLVSAVAPLALIGVVAARRSARLCRHSRGVAADRHPDRQLGDPDRADRTFARGRNVRLGSGGRSDRTPDAADHADGSGSQPRTDPDCQRDLLGADGLCDDGRHHRRHGTDIVAVGALRRLVPHQRAHRSENPAGTTEGLSDNASPSQPGRMAGFGAEPMSGFQPAITRRTRRAGPGPGLQIAR